MVCRKYPSIREKQVCLTLLLNKYTKKKDYTCFESRVQPCVKIFRQSRRVFCIETGHDEIKKCFVAGDHSHYGTASDH